MKKKSIWAVVVAGCAQSVLTAQSLNAEADAAGNSHHAPPGTRITSTRTIEFETNEGTSMNVDVSPDARTLVFDLLGDLYLLPVSGGKAQPLLGGRAWDRCPRFSPDGKEIAFISDRVGVDSVWVLNLASRKLRRLTDRHDRATGAGGIPEWLPGGREIVYGYRDVGRMTLSVVPASGGASSPLIPEWNQPADPRSRWFGVHSATIAPDGQAYFAAFERVEVVGRSFGYSLYSFDPRSQAITRLTERAPDRDELRPEVSRSGRLLAYVRSNGPGDIELRIRNLEDESDRRLIGIPEIEPSFNDWSFSGAGERPAYAFTPDDRFVILWYGGRLHRISAADGSESGIPFVVHVRREISAPVRAQYRIPDGPLNVRGLRWPTVSRDGSRLVFSAVGSIWITSLRGRPQRVTASDDFELMPAVSPDGKHLAYVAFPHTRHETLAPGRLRIRQLESGKTREVEAGEASNYFPRWSADGERIAVVRQSGFGRGARVQLGWIELATGEFHAVAEAGPISESVPALYAFGPHITFSGDGKSLLYQRGSLSDGKLQQSRSLHRVALDGSGDEILATADRENVLGMYPSPDGSKVLFIGWNLQAYLTDLPKLGAGPIHLSIPPGPAPAFAIKRISERGSLYPVWVDDRELTFGWTNEIFRYRVGEAAARPLAHIDLQVPRRGGQGIVAFTNARLITIAGRTGAGPVIEHGTLVVRDRRIEAVGSAERVAIPAGATVVDASGLTIMPGFVDSHSHGLGNLYSGTPIGRNYSSRSALAYGITTAWEAKGLQDDGNLVERELSESGSLLGQRWFSAGGIVNRKDAAPPYRSLDEVRASVRQKVELGAEQCLKDRQERVRAAVQWYATAAREAGVCLVAHTESFPEILAYASDGVMVDHSMLPAPSYRDVVQYLAATGVTWTPHTTLTASLRTGVLTTDRVLLGELMDRGDEAQVSKYDRLAQSMHGPERTALQDLEFTPRISFDRTAAFREAQVAAQIAAAGGKVAVSSDGGAIQNHFEMWALHRGGMPAGEALRAATLNGAEKLGLQDDLGSLAAGKLADFLLLNANPLDRIENSLAIKYVVLAGEIYEGATLDRVSPERLSTH